MKLILGDCSSVVLKASPEWTGYGASDRCSIV
jgi:hypothetical protein